MLAETECQPEQFPSSYHFFDLDFAYLPGFLAEFLHRTPVLRWTSQLPDLLAQIDLEALPGTQKVFPPSADIGHNVYVHESVRVPKNCAILSNTYIGRNVELRPGCYIRGNSVILDGAVIGNSSEVKSAIILRDAQIPHFNYVGDAVVGQRAHLGAGAILSNYRLDGKPVKIKRFFSNSVYVYNTEADKFSAILADEAQVGCNSVLCPGSVLEKGQIVGPCTKWTGWHAE